MRDFRAVYIRFGSKAAQAISASPQRMSASPRKRTNSGQSRYVRLVPKADSCTAAKALPIFEQLGVSSGNFS
jgi:hypothetical protein